MSASLGMIPYYVMLLILLICIGRENSLQSIKAKKINLIIALIPVFVLIAFKAERIGSDTSNYLNTFSNFSDEIEVGEEGEKTMEIGYQVLMILLRKISDSNQLLLVVLGLLTAVSLYFYIRWTSTNWCLALYFFVCLGFFQFSMTGIRQTMAIDIILLSYPFIKNKKIISFFVVVGIATLFHKSAVVFIPIYWIANMEIRTRNTVLMLIVMSLLFIKAEDILLTTAEVLNYQYGIEKTDNGGIFLVVVILIFVAAYSRRESILAHNKDAKILYNSNYVSVILWVIRLVSRTVERVSLYFMPYTYILLEQFLESLPNENKRRFKFIVICLATILFLYRMSYQTSLNNYSFFWQ